MDRRNLVAKIVEIGESQHGVVATSDLRRIGCRANEAARLCERGFLVRKHQGVYAVGTSRLSMHGKSIAAVLACSGPTVVSHRSAAALWRLGDFREPVEVSRPRGGRSWRPGVRIHQPRDFELIEPHFIRGVPVTSVGRTLFDCAAVVEFETLEDMAATAHRRKLITAQELRFTLAANIRRPGAVAFSELVGELDLDVLFTRSRMERAIIRLCVASGIRKPQAGAKVAGFEVDLLWEEEKLIVEFDSGAFHSDFASIERDRLRDARHTWNGYRVFRVTYRMLKREPERVVAQIRRLLAVPPAF